jgi:hypothetical protein
MSGSELEEREPTTPGGGSVRFTDVEPEHLAGRLADVEGRAAAEGPLDATDPGETPGDACVDRPL